MLTGEQLFQILVMAFGFTGTMLGAWAFSKRTKAEAERDRVKADAQVRISQAEAEKHRIQAEADAKVKESEANLNESLKDRESAASTNRLVERQLDIIEKMDATAKARDAEHLERYSTGIAVSKDINEQLLTISSDTKIILKWIAELPKSLAAVNTGTLTEFAQHLGAEMGQVLAQQVAMQQMSRDLFPFPDSDDPRWERVRVIPTSPNAKLWKYPLYKDDAVLNKPCAQIAPEGEIVKLIRGQIKNWWIIYKVGTDSDCWGWIPEGKLRILEDAPAAMG